MHSIWALIRDNFRCMATGLVDSDLWVDLPEIDPAAGSSGMTRTECCHTFPESMNADLDKVNFIFPLIIMRCLTIFIIIPCQARIDSQCVDHPLVFRISRDQN